ncbi:DUF6891 domain-containing protein [Corynebacterium pacaense]|uniref:DUF6891 domain-containing protein n=1 Tax=Corynebacterium pacaense TaxID=1816684 RepID=UPI001177339D|nr:hypothetical protein [Corynebacterium pacaense]
MTDITELLSNDNYWFIDDLRRRILNGDILDPEDAYDHLEEVLEDEDPGELPGDIGDLAVDIVNALWEEAFALADGWAEETTDVDRLVAAFEDLIDNHDIDAGIFTDHASIQARPGQRGVALVWVNAWEELSHESTTGLAVTTASRSEDVSDDAIAAEVAMVLSGHGLAVTGTDAQGVGLDVLWRHHVPEIGED